VVWGMWNSAGLLVGLLSVLAALSGWFSAVVVGTLPFISWHLVTLGIGSFCFFHPGGWFRRRFSVGQVLSFVCAP
jgi:hypothetical protein